MMLFYTGVLASVILHGLKLYRGYVEARLAAILGYSGAGKAVALPALVKTLEMSTGSYIFRMEKITDTVENTLKEKKIV